MRLSDLYQDIIVDHGKNPRNKRAVEGATHTAVGHNTLCGDQVQVTVRVKDGVIEDLAFEGCGCAISTASASLMTMELKGKRIEEVDGLMEAFLRATKTGETSEDLGELECLAGVCQYPARVKCATLCWHTVKSALTDGGEVSTEGGDA